MSVRDTGSSAAVGVLGPVVNPADGTWGVVGTANDSATFQRALNSLAAGGLFYIPNGTWRVMNLVVPAAVSITVMGASMTNAIVRCPAATPVNPIWDLSNRNGPALRFHNFKYVGANTGLFESTGFKMSTTNGAFFDRIWGAGLLIARDCFNPCTGIFSQGVVSESCGIGMNYRSDPTECVNVGEVYFNNQQDLQVTGDCSSFVHSGSVSNNCTNTSVLATAATSFSMSDFKIRTAATGINLTTSQDAMLTDGIISGSTVADFSNTGTLRMYANNVLGDLSPFRGAQLFAGQIVGGKRIMLSTAIPTTLTWAVGDQVYNSVPGVGNPKGWVCTAAGTPGTWVSMGNL